MLKHADPWIDDAQPSIIPATQQVLMLQKFGGPEGFAVLEQPVPEPADDELLVKVLAASVQYTDVILRKGRYPDLKEKPPLVLGYDLVGEVLQLGKDVRALAVGERVADLTMSGSYAQYRTLKAAQVVRVDPALDPAEVSALLLSWMTAYQLLHRDARVQRGQKLLIIGAAGAVGQALVVLGRLAGCVVWGTARARHASVLRSLGAIHIDSADQADLSKVLPRGFDVVFDGVGQEGFSPSWHAVGPRGHLSAYGFSEAVQRNTSFAVLGYWFAKLWLWNAMPDKRSASFFSITGTRKKHPEWFAADLGTLLGLLARGDIKPRISERIGLGAVADAHARLERGGLDGKLVLLPNG